ncbi:ketosteroid isomerase-like protein [Sphingobium sp. B1D7B]|uniref:nuclear transport factor 2 family protein n=1 Tax=Sphingobium sp. B1D7B TaxID=2940578 RepID=UPI00222496BB|nr:nuclear transport factor 2 family protein [Sphingobium sp. B1D7B]MCW2404587.1 ketosteroid isomerase-like protein [Sphingobium sp. B1D7B]
MKLIALLAIGLMAVMSPGATLAQEAAAHEMTRQRFEEYLRLFNAGDERFAQFYANDVVFHHAPMFGVLKGRQAIVDFYKNIRLQVSEEVTPHVVVVDNRQGLMAAELSTRLVALRDGVAMPSGNLKRGDMIMTEGTVYYTLENGLISTIRGSRSGAQKVPAGSAAR